MKNNNFLRDHIFIIIALPILLLLSFIIYKDYGISIDEESTRMHGLVSLNYLCNIFFPNSLFEFQINNKIPSFSSYPHKEYGVFFEMIMIFFTEIFLNLKSFSEIFYMRHLLNNLLFMSSLFFFYLISLEIFKNKYYPIFSVLILYTSPRIFAESFYNNKDIVFMSLLIYTIYFAIKFLKNVNYKNALFFALALAITINIRVIGIYLLLIFILFLLIKTPLKKIYKQLIFFLTLFLLLSYSFWPFLWEAPIENFLYSLKSFSKYEWGLNVFYLGDFYLDKYLPWHYFYILFFATNSVFLTLIIVLGLSVILFRFIKRYINIDKNKLSNDLWKGDKESIILFLFFTAATPLFLVYLFDSIIYSGWRHLYFIFPSLVLIGVYFIDYLSFILKSRKLIKWLPLFLVLIIFNNVFNLIKFHPFQYVYFNKLFEKKANSWFEIDYWGVANKQALLDMANVNLLKNNIIIGVASFSDLNLSKKMLNNKLKNKIIISGQNFDGADFIFNNNYSEVNPKVDDKYTIPINYKKFSYLKKGKIIIYEIYKKSDRLK